MDDQICRDTDIYKAKSNEDPQSSVSKFEIKVFWLSFLHNFEILSAFLVSRQVLGGNFFYYVYSIKASTF